MKYIINGIAIAIFIAATTDLDMSQAKWWIAVISMNFMFRPES